MILMDAPDFSLPSYYAEHGIISVMIVPHPGSESATVWCIGSREHYSPHLRCYRRQLFDRSSQCAGTSDRCANVGVSLNNVTDRLHDMIADRERYIAAHERIVAGQKRLMETSNVLTRELEHRVRNNLQLIYSMLSQQLNTTTDEAGIEGFGKIARQVMILVEIYEQLLGTDLGRTIDFGAYLSSLCSSFTALHTASHPKVELTCQVVPINLGLDVVTALGLVVSELVTNSYTHAFPDGAGTIKVSLSANRSGDGCAHHYRRRRGVHRCERE